MLVPWVTSWSSEDRFEVRPCRYAEGERAVWQPYSPGVGTPIFKGRHWVRGRKAVAEMLCVTCGKPAPPDDRWIFISGEWQAPAGEWLLALGEGVSHRACADLAVRLCPHVGARGWQPQPLPATHGRMLYQRDMGPRGVVATHLRITLPEVVALELGAPPPSTPCLEAAFGD